jgi:hypothetical protein
MRTCRTCNAEKSLMEFYCQTNGSLYRDCKDCWKAYVRANRLARVEQYQEYERGRANLPHRVEARKEYAQSPEGRASVSRAKRRFIERNPAKRAAHVLVGNALRDGRLTRQPCECCGAWAQAHHDDYGKPLDVRWLCPKHHAEWHKHNTPKCPDQEQAA